MISSDVIRGAETKTDFVKRTSNLDSRCVFSVESHVRPKHKEISSTSLGLALVAQAYLASYFCHRHVMCKSQIWLRKKISCRFFSSLLSTSSYKIRKRFEVQPIFTMFDFLDYGWSFFMAFNWNESFTFLSFWLKVFLQASLLGWWTFKVPPEKPQKCNPKLPATPNSRKLIWNSSNFTEIATPTPQPIHNDETISYGT